ncbi:MAG: DUF364 domain-containing protein [Treponema sp.]|jgi:uncharacterized protein (DUF4213/DUF364 family)|nr:DUF364 domain-containing protein [Treponema sp.]
MNSHDKPWTIYDALIESIPPDYPVDEVIQGGHWTMVRSGGGTGLAMTLTRNVGDEVRPRTLPPALEGLPLRELARASKSWNFAEASMGIAALGAYWNSPERPQTAKALENRAISAFESWRERVRGKKAAVIGHFMHLERTLAPICELSILEQRPREGDYPASACEFLLPLQDFVFATGVTLTNKTFPRLLELSRPAEFILVGPSTPLCPLLLDFGVRDLQGFAVTNPELCRAIVLDEREDLSIFDAGRRVSLCQ